LADVGLPTPIMERAEPEQFASGAGAAEASAGSDADVGTELKAGDDAKATGAGAAAEGLPRSSLDMAPLAPEPAGSK
jgi:hypothetical protein